MVTVGSDSCAQIETLKARVSAAQIQLAGSLDKIRPF